MAGFIIPEAELRKQAAADGITHLSSGIAVMDGPKVLVVRRAPADFLGGSYELPGGGVEDGEAFDQSVQRELKEETNLETVEILGMFPGFDYSTPNKPHVRQFNFLVRAADLKTLNLSDEHDQFAWVASDDEVDALGSSAVMKMCIKDALSVAQDVQDMLIKEAA